MAHQVVKICVLTWKICLLRSLSISGSFMSCIVAPRLPTGKAEVPLAPMFVFLFLPRDLGLADPLLLDLCIFTDLSWGLAEVLLLAPVSGMTTLVWALWAAVSWALSLIVFFDSITSSIWSTSKSSLPRAVWTKIKRNHSMRLCVFWGPVETDSLVYLLRS